MNNDVSFHPPTSDHWLLSVVVPVFNERRTLPAIVDRLFATGLPLEIILVDDGSCDGSAALCEQLAATDARIQLCRHERNRGKGAAVTTGFARTKGDYVVVQDADLEYDPQDLHRLLEPLQNDSADVVYGSRYTTKQLRAADGWHYYANGVITRLSNFRTGLSLTDVETCYKVCRQSYLRRITPGLKEQGFGIELELTSRLARAGARIVERPIRYAARGYADGKKITWRDGLRALWCAVVY